MAEEDVPPLEEFVTISNTPYQLGTGAIDLWARYIPTEDPLHPWVGSALSYVAITPIEATFEAIYFDDTFNGAAGPLSGHTPEIGTWDVGDGLVFYEVGFPTNDGTYASSVQLDGNGNRIIAYDAGAWNLNLDRYAYKAITNIPVPNYTVLVEGKFFADTGNQYVLVALRSAAGATRMDFVGALIYTGADTGEVEVYAVDFQESNNITFEDLVWTSVGLDVNGRVDIALLVRVVGDQLYIKVNDVLVSTITINPGHLTNVPGDVYLIEQTTDVPSLITEFAIGQGFTYTPPPPPPPPPPAFFLDTFAGAAGDLISHTTDNGLSYGSENLASTANWVLDGNGRLPFVNTGAEAVAHFEPIPSLPWRIRVDFCILDVTPDGCNFDVRATTVNGLGVRTSEPAQFGLWHGSGWNLIMTILNAAGAAIYTTDPWVSPTITGAPQTMEVIVSVSGTQLLLDGVLLDSTPIVSDAIPNGVYFQGRKWGVTDVGYLDKVEINVLGSVPYFLETFTGSNSTSVLDRRSDSGALYDAADRTLFMLDGTGGMPFSTSFGSAGAAVTSDFLQVASNWKLDVDFAFMTPLPGTDQAQMNISPYSYGATGYFSLLVRAGTYPNIYLDIAVRLGGFTATIDITSYIFPRTQYLMARSANGVTSIYIDNIRVAYTPTVIAQPPIGISFRAHNGVAAGSLTTDWSLEKIELNEWAGAGLPFLDTFNANNGNLLEHTRVTDSGHIYSGTNFYPHTPGFTGNLVSFSGICQVSLPWGSASPILHPASPDYYLEVVVLTDGGTTDNDNVALAIRWIDNDPNYLGYHAYLTKRDATKDRIRYGRNIPR